MICSQMFFVCSLFSPNEFNELVGGGVAETGSVEDMRKHTRYSGGYTMVSPTIKMFWRVVKELNVDQRRGLLRFVTSCSRAPLGGFQYLHPPLTIHMVTRMVSCSKLFLRSSYHMYANDSSFSTLIFW